MTSGAYWFGFPRLSALLKGWGMPIWATDKGQLETVGKKMKEI